MCEAQPRGTAPSLYNTSTSTSSASMLGYTEWDSQGVSYFVLHGFCNTREKHRWEPVEWKKSQLKRQPEVGYTHLSSQHSAGKLRQEDLKFK